MDWSAIILVCISILTLTKAQFRRVRYRPSIRSSSTIASQVSYRSVDGSSDCALILLRTIAFLPSGNEPLSVEPQFGGSYDFIQRSTSTDQRLPTFGRSLGSRFSHQPSKFSYIDHYSTPIHQFRSRRFKRDVRRSDEGENQTEEVCVHYSDINDAFRHISRTNKGCLPASHRNAVHAPNVNDIASSAECMLKVSKTIAEKYGMSNTEITQALSLIDLKQTDLYDACPSIVKPAPCTAEKYREIDGRCNNLLHPSRGVAKTPFTRLLSPQYGDGISSLKKSVGGHNLPLVRELSTACHGDINQSSNEISQMYMAFGQILDHDLTFSAPTLVKGKDFKCCGLRKEDQHKNCHTIEIPLDDYFHGVHGRKCMEFKRTLPAQRVECSLGPREQINQATAVIDTNFVYGTNEKQKKRLRTFHQGLLKTVLPDSFQFRGYKPILPPRTSIPDKGCIGRNRYKGLYCFEAGDGRVNENVYLTSLHVVFLREHNRLARILSKLNPNWDDHKLYEEARRINAAVFQHITYNEYLPATLGSQLMHKYHLELAQDYWYGYDEKVNSGVLNSFMTAAFRFSHSNIDNKIDRYNKHHQLTESVNMREFFRQPFSMYEPGAVDEFLLGMLNQPSQKTDPFMGEEVTNHLFEKPFEHFGIDLSATNIKRGRDHGLPGYNEFRKKCKLPVAKNFDDLSSILQNKTAFVFSKLYKHVDDVDLWSAGIAEKLLPGAMVGPTFGCIIGLQFRNTRHGDRFWYENPSWPSSFTIEKITEIKKMTMARLLCDNGDNIETTQKFTMYLPHPSRNPRLHCSELPQMDLSYWQENNFSNDISTFYKK